MRYKFVAAYCVHGLTMNSGDGCTTIYQDNDMHVFLTADITPSLAILDRQHAIGAGMLGAFVGQAQDGALCDTWRGLVQKTIAERNLRYKQSAFVVIEVEGEVAATVPNDLPVQDGHAVCRDAYDKNTVAELSETYVANALSAMRLAAPTACQFELVTRGSFLIAETGHIIHSMSYSLSGSMTVSRRLEPAHVQTMGELIGTLKASPELIQPLDLHAQSLNHQETRLRSFMAAWNALEQFTFTVNKKYSALWEAERNESTTSSARLTILNSIPDKSSGKLAVAFGKMACALGEADAISDIAEILALKGIRNALSHELKDKELPVERVQLLMDKYLKKHLGVT